MEKQISVSKIHKTVVTPIKTNELFRSSPYQYTMTGVADNAAQNNCSQNVLNCEQIVLKPIIVKINKP